MKLWATCAAQLVGPLGFGPGVGSGAASGTANNAWCAFSHRGQCSFAGVYQPELPPPDTAYGHFYLLGGYLKVCASRG